MLKGYTSAQRLAPKLAVFLHDLKNVVRSAEPQLKEFRRTKVAIIDNGILGITPRTSYSKRSDEGGEHQSMDEKNLLSRVKDGCSFVDDHSKLGSWLFASDPHGTQMANLICAIDPLCDLYVAKVTEDKYGITKDRVARVCGSFFLRFFLAASHMLLHRLLTFHPSF
jgi:hypothetical protein